MVSAFASGNLAVLCCQVPASFMVARLAGPERLGYLNTMGLFLAYLPICLLGILNGLNRELPLLVGQKQVAVAKALADTAWWWTRLVAIVAGAGLATAGIVLCVKGQVKLGQACCTYALISPLTLLAQGIEVTYRTGGEFLKLSKYRLAIALLGIASVPLLWASSWWGLLARVALLSAAYFWLLYRGRPIRFCASFNKQAWTRLARVGLPIFIVGYLFVIFSALDQTLVVQLLGVKQLGLYTPAIQVAAGLGVLPSSISQVLYPRMCEAYGRTDSARSLSALAFVPMAALAFGLAPAFAIVWWLVDPLVRHVLPQYVEGIAAARWVVVTMYFWSIATPLCVFATLNKLAPYAVAIILGSIGAILITLGLHHQGFGLAAMAAGQAGGMAILVVTAVVGASILVFGGDRRNANRQPPL